MTDIGKVFTRHGNEVRLCQKVGYSVVSNRRVTLPLYDVVYCGRTIGHLGWTSKVATIREKLSPLEADAVADALTMLVERKVDVRIIGDKPKSAIEVGAGFQGDEDYE